MGKEKTSILDVVPVLEKDVKITIGEEGVYTLSFPALREGSILSFMRRFSKNKFMELDQQGTEVVKQIDGKRNVEEIIRNLSDYFEHKDDYAARIVMFISGLKANGAIKYTVPTRKED